MEERRGLGRSRQQHSAFQKDWHARTQLFLGNPHLLSPAESVITGLALTLTLAAWGSDAASLCVNVKENAHGGLRDTQNNRQFVVLGKQHWRDRGWKKGNRWLVKTGLSN